MQYVFLTMTRHRKEMSGVHIKSEVEEKQPSHIFQKRKVTAKSVFHVKLPREGTVDKTPTFLIDETSYFDLSLFLYRSIQETRGVSSVVFCIF